MTCVAAVARDGRVFIGSDSCASGDGVFIVSASPKVVKINDLIVGFAGSWSIGRRVFRFLTKTNDVEKLLDTFDAEDDDE